MAMVVGVGMPTAPCPEYSPLRPGPAECRWIGGMRGSWRVMATRSEPNPAQIAAWGGGVVKAMDPTEGVAPDGLQTNPWKQDVTKKDILFERQKSMHRHR